MNELSTPAGPQRILLVRHAQSEWNAAGRWQGQADPALSPFGKQQARTLAEHPLLSSFDAIVSSDLQRARQTAGVIAHDHDVAIDAGLRELDVGSWSGRTRAEIESDQPGAIARYKLGETMWEGGETLDEHTARARAVALRLESWPIDGELVAVSHGGTIRILLSLFLGMGDAGRERFAHVHHASVTALQRSATGWQLASFGV
ncbi:MAG: histidine phosphatase family protein [Gaiellales bacterium]